MDLLDELESRVVCGDGAMGTLLLNSGVPIERCLEELCLSEPDRIRIIHEHYITGGARVIKTNTFGANAVRLSRFGLEAKVTEINRAAARVARTAAQGQQVYVAGSIGPLGISRDEAVTRGIDREQCFVEQLTALLDEGVHLIFFETFMDVEEIEIAFRAKKTVSDLPAICSFSCTPDGRLASGGSLGEAFKRLSREGAKIIGVNCMNNPDEMLRLLPHVPSETLLAVYPAAGQPRRSGASLVYETTPDAFSESVPEMVGRGARLLGGCCGTTPAHIAALAARIGTL